MTTATPTLYTFEIKEVEWAYDEGDKSQEILDNATALIVGKELTVESEDDLDDAITQLTGLDTYSFTFSEIVSDEEEERRWNETISEVYNSCEESGEKFDHAMGRVLAGIDGDY